MTMTTTSTMWELQHNQGGIDAGRMRTIHFSINILHSLWRNHKMSLAINQQWLQVYHDECHQRYWQGTIITVTITSTIKGALNDQQLRRNCNSQLEVAVVAVANGDDNGNAMANKKVAISWRWQLLQLQAVMAMAKQKK